MFPQTFERLWGRVHDILRLVAATFPHKSCMVLQRLLEPTESLFLDAGNTEKLKFTNGSSSHSATVASSFERKVNSVL